MNSFLSGKYSYPHLWLWIVVLVMVFHGGAASEPGSRRLEFYDDFENGLSAHWQVVKFKGQTKYRVVREGSNQVLEAVADRSASGIAIRKSIPVRPGTRLEWRWKIEGVPANGSETAIETYDHAARLFVAFKSLLGPPRTINYLWGNQAAAASTGRHPTSQSGNDAAGKWIEESRDLHADWKLLFHSDPPDELQAIGLMTDSDGTGTVLRGWYDEVRIVCSDAAEKSR
jgi:hypothetical protein